MVYIYIQIFNMNVLCYPCFARVDVLVIIILINCMSEIYIYWRTHSWLTSHKTDHVGSETPRKDNEPAWLYANFGHSKFWLNLIIFELISNFDQPTILVDGLFGIWTSCLNERIVVWLKFDINSNMVKYDQNLA